MKKSDIRIYNYEKQFAKRKQELAENKNITKEGKAKILSYINDLGARQSKGRQLKNLYTILSLSNRFGMRFDQLDKDNITKAINELHDSEFSSWTKHDYKAIVKQYIKWFIGAENYKPTEWAFIRVKLKKSEKTHLTANDILSVEEVEKMISHCDNTRNKAIIGVLYESGCRPSEILTLRFGDVTSDRHGYVLHLNKSKTFTRDVRLVNSVPYLKSWRNIHPLKDENSPLWITTSTKGKHEPVSLATLRKMMILAASKAGICKLKNNGRNKQLVIESGKRIYPYIMRHSRISHMLQNPKYPLATIKYQVGWDEDTTQLSTYQHISDKTHDKAVLAANNVITHEETAKVELENRISCWNCGSFNNSTATECESCNFPMSMNDMAATMAEIKKITPYLAEITKMRNMTDNELKKFTTVKTK